jgi:hypothetical protein
MVASYPRAIRTALDRAGRKGSIWLSLAAEETSSGTAIFLHKLTNGFHTRSPPKGGLLSRGFDPASHPIRALGIYNVQAGDRCRQQPRS